MTTRKSE